MMRWSKVHIRRVSFSHESPPETFRHNELDIMTQKPVSTMGPILLGEKRLYRYKLPFNVDEAGDTKRIQCCSKDVTSTWRTQLLSV